MRYPRTVLRLGIVKAMPLWVFVLLPVRLSMYGQEQSLEQRQPLELVYADSIVPQDRHEMMLTSGLWYMRHGTSRDALLTQKMEWGISDRLQVAVFFHAVNSSNILGPTETGIGDLEIGARYTWATVGSRFTHIAVAFDAGFPTGNPRKGLGEATYTLSPSVLLSHEFGRAKCQMFSTTGLDFAVAHRALPLSMDAPHDSLFSNNGLALRLGHGWAVGEFSVTSNR
jgi:hypothetical protein